MCSEYEMVGVNVENKSVMLHNLVEVVRIGTYSFMNDAVCLYAL